jgi:hypothetical protein
MTPEFIFKAWYNSNVEVAALIFYENYWIGNYYVFQLNIQIILR